MMERALRTRLGFLRPNLDSQVLRQQAQQQQYHDSHCRPRTFAVGDKVLAKNFRPGSKWVPGTVVDCLSPMSYQVKVHNGMIWRRHVDHLQHIVQSEEDRSSDTSTDDYTMLPDVSTEPSEGTASQSQSTSIENNSRHYPQRIRRPPQRYQ